MHHHSNPKLFLYLFDARIILNLSDFNMIYIIPLARRIALCIKHHLTYNLKIITSKLLSYYLDYDKTS